MQTAELKEEYKKAKVARAHHEEYMKLAELISKYPSQEETEATVKALKTDIAALEEEKQQLQDKLSRKNGQFQLLLHAIQSLQTVHEAERPLEPPGKRRRQDDDDHNEDGNNADQAQAGPKQWKWTTTTTTTKRRERFDERLLKLFFSTTVSGIAGGARCRRTPG